MQARQRPGRKEAGQEKLRVALQDDEIREAALPGALPDELAVYPPRLDADEVQEGIARGMIEGEVSVTGPDLQFEGSAAAKASFPVGKYLGRERATVRQGGRIESARVLASHGEPCLLSRAFRHNPPRGFRSCGSV